LAIQRIVESTNNGNRSTQVEFHVLKEYKNPSTYSPEVYWYNTSTRAISKSVLDEDKALIVHGPYKRYVDGALVEEGNYYAGTKDGRWENYDANYVLLDKTKWWRGFPMESAISYYDSAHTKIREVMPIQYGKRKGDYLKFYESGQLMAKGQYDNDMPVGLWTEYFPLKRQRKKLSRYPRYWYEYGEAVVMNEWDEKGKLTYERPKEKLTQESEN
jgi:antitoxin component YwqK of YwqJK toxin-antitoxin module